MDLFTTLLLLAAWLVIILFIIEKLFPNLLPHWLSIHKLMIRRGAKNTIKSNKVFWGEERHEWRDVADPMARFPDLDHVWIAATAGKFEQLGWRLPRSIENWTINKSNRAMRTYVHAMLSPDGRTSVGIYHFKLRGFMGWFLGMIGTKTNIRVIDLESEFDDGTYLCITTAPRKSTLHEPPHTTRCFAPEDATPEQLQEWHEAWLYYLHQMRGVVPNIMTSQEDMEEMEHRRHAKDSAYRRSVNYFTEVDAQRIPPNERFARDGVEMSRSIARLRGKAGDGQ